MSHPAMRLTHLTSANLGDAPTASPFLKVQAGGLGHSLRITNLDGANNLEISFNNGRDFYPIAPGLEFSTQALFHFFVIRGVGGAVAWTAVVEAG